MNEDIIGELFVASDNAIRWDGLYDRIAREFITDATITWVIRAAATDGSFDAAGALVANGGGTMAYIAASRGNYVGTIEDDAALTAGSKYWIVVSMSASGDRVDTRYLPMIAARRRST